MEITPVGTERHKVGDARADGLFFLRYSRHREIWGTAEQLAAFRADRTKRAREWRTKNPERYEAIVKAFWARVREKDPGGERKMRAATSKKWIDASPSHREAYRMRVRVACALKLCRGGRCLKTAKTVELIGCSWTELVQHLEKQFLPGMSWENRSEWHVDHIRPCASFDLTDPAQQRICFHYTNLRPLWAADNIRKGARYDQPRADR